MYVPILTSGPKSGKLERRKGGGGSGSKSSSKGGSGTTSTGGETSSGSNTVPLSTSTASGKTSATAYGSGGGSTFTIPGGQLFAGRSAGGGTRVEVFGTRTYGSGYPGIQGRGVAGRGFPFWFWPIVWIGVQPGSYLDAPEYGDSYNTSRVGGPIAEATFASNSTNTIFHVLSDNVTVSSLISSIDANCSSSLSSSSSILPQAYNASAPWAAKPEQAIHYYRASSVVLTLDGYNNSATLSSETNATDSPLPSGIDTTLLDCLNQTIGLSAPLVSSAGVRWSTGPPITPILSLLLVAWWMFGRL
ncbi:hypothetical protein HD554DRAFT_449957 [Boletus coccyginus]|nr:hypothetical protein HD554DRAFT_449957 [Boletus coccyginus]